VVLSRWAEATLCFSGFHVVTLHQTSAEEYVRYDGALHGDGGAILFISRFSAWNGGDRSFDSD
jgi:hypothetical protein